jgi:uncharacterized protein YdaU (DUF1376 family)
VSDYHKPKLTRFDFDVDDFLGSEDVKMMDDRTCGQYIFLLLEAWDIGKDCTLPDDEVALVKLSRSTTGKVEPIVLKKFRKTDNGRLVNDRLLKEWRAAQQRADIRTEKALKAGLASAQARRERDSESTPSQLAVELAGTPKPAQAVSKPEGAGMLEGASASPSVSDSGKQGIPVPKLEAKGNRLASDEGYELCKHVKAELSLSDHDSEWLPVADEILSYAGGAAALPELKQIFSWGIRHEHFVKYLTGIPSFKRLLESKSDRGLKNQFYAAKRSKELKASTPAKPKVNEVVTAPNKKSRWLGKEIQ